MFLSRDVCVLQEDRQLLEEQEAVLEAVNVVNHDIDECVHTLEKIYHQKLDRLTKFGGITYISLYSSSSLLSVLMIRLPCLL